MRLEPAEARRLAAAADHAVLATIGPDGRPDLVPACLAIDDDVVGIPIDRVKPKASSSLQRERNVERDPRASLLLERWDAADWSRLWWVRLELERSSQDAAVVARLEALLRRRYPQYATEPFVSILTFRILRVSGWAATPPTT